MGEVTNVEMVTIKERLSGLEARLREYDEGVRSFYKNDWSKLDRMSEQIHILIDHIKEDRLEHKALEARVLHCETEILKVRGEILKGISELEKKFLKFVSLAAVISGGGAASVIKLLSMF